MEIRSDHMTKGLLQTFLQVPLLLTLCCLYANGHQHCAQPELLEYEPVEPEMDIPEAPNRILGMLGLDNIFPSQFSHRDRLPWHCAEVQIWRDLGESYFPRYIPEVRCANSTCLNGHYRCRPSLYTIKVLTNNQVNCRDQTLPANLRRHWVMAHVRTSTACQCQPRLTT